jgi:hypothetical protein
MFARALTNSGVTGPASGRTGNKLAEFGVQPFRGRKVKPAPEPPPQHTPPAGTGQ